MNWDIHKILTSKSHLRGDSLPGNAQKKDWAGQKRYLGPLRFLALLQSQENPQKFCTGCFRTFK